MSPSFHVADRSVIYSARYNDRAVTLFGQLGIGDPRVDRFAYYTGSGLTFSAPFPGRKEDEFGIAVAASHNGTPFIKAQRNQGISSQRSEVSLEMTYLARLGAHLAVQPDLQYVINPNTDPRTKNALALMLRFELSL